MTHGNRRMYVRDVIHPAAEGVEASSPPATGWRCSAANKMDTVFQTQSLGILVQPGFLSYQAAKDAWDPRRERELL